MLEQAIKYVLTEARVILEAPLLFIAAFLVSASIIAAFFRNRYAIQISTLNERINLRDDQLSDFKEKLQTGSPDQAKERIELLERMVSDLQATRPRRLNDEQVKTLSALAKLAPEQRSAVGVSHDMACGDCNIYASDLAKALVKAGWDVGQGMFLGTPYRPPTGVLLSTTSGGPTPADNVLAEALRRAGVAFDLQTGTHGGSHPEIMIMPKL